MKLFSLRTPSIQSVLIKTTVVNVIAFLLMLIAAFFSNSGVIYSSLTGLSLVIATSIISLYAYMLSQRRADLKFNYGLGKIEELSTIFVCIFFILICILILIGTLYRYRQNISIQLNGWSILPFCFLILKNIYIFAISKENQDSSILTTQRKLYAITIAASSFSFFSIAIQYLFRDTGYVYEIDVFASTIICMLTIIRIYPLLKVPSLNLLDCTLSENMQLAIMKSLAVNFESYEYIKDIRSRRSGSHYFIEILMVFKPTLTMEEFEKISQEIKSIIMNGIPDAHIMIEPSCIIKK